MTAWRICNGCNRNRLLDGGCSPTPTRWLCQVCWLKFVQRKFK